MALTPDSTIDVAKAIQLALGPVFLLTGIAGMLNVMAGRLARIIDRGRALTEGRAGSAAPGQPAVDFELRTLEQRRHFTSIAITACTIAALLVCMVILTLFVEAMLDAPLKWLIGSLFAAGTLALVVGLGYFLREVHLATQTIRIPAPKSG
ncbi:MAG TPA: DUF2721 domain-containing protein [Burkholderiaceae bacterium]|nr:DUF2721 domain-containing protein [Burkholderiaceae bacterium]